MKIAIMLSILDRQKEVLKAIQENRMIKIDRSTNAKHSKKQKILTPPIQVVSDISK